MVDADVVIGGVERQREHSLQYVPVPCRRGQNGC